MSTTTKYFDITIPPNVLPGEKFGTKIHGKVYHIICPAQSAPGSRIRFGIQVPAVEPKEVVPPKVATVPKLPAGWEARVDPSSGQTYYIDHVHKKSQWEAPSPPSTALPPPMASQAKILSSDSAKSPTVCKSRDETETTHAESDIALEPTATSIVTPRSSQKAVSTSLAAITATASASVTTESTRSTSQPTFYSTAKTARPFPPYDASAARVAINYHEYAAQSKGLNGYVQKKVDGGWKGLRQSWKQARERTLPRDVEGVTLNEYPLSLPQAQWFAINFGVIFRSHTHYWYDSCSGFLGKVGGRTKHVVDPEIAGIQGHVDPRASCCGATQVFVNGREQPKTELREWKWLGIPLQAGQRYTVDPAGFVFVEGAPHPMANWRDHQRAFQRQLQVAVTGVPAMGLGPPRPVGGPRPGPHGRRPQRPQQQRPQRQEEQQEGFGFEGIVEAWQADDDDGADEAAQESTWDGEVAYEEQPQVWAAEDDGAHEYGDMSKMFGMMNMGGEQYDNQGDWGDGAVFGSFESSMFGGFGGSGCGDY